MKELRFWKQKVSKGNNSKIHKVELWFLNSALLNMHTEFNVIWNLGKKVMFQKYKIINGE